MKSSRADLPQEKRPGGSPLFYLVPIWLIAVGLVVAGWKLAGPPDDLIAVLVFCVLGVMSWLVREDDVGSRVSFSFSSIIVLASGVIVGPVGAALVGTATALPVIFGKRVPARVTSFNVAMMASVGAIGGLVYLAAGGASELTHVEGAESILLEIGLPVMAADVAQCLANAVLLAGVMRVANAVPMRTQLWKLISVTGVAYIGYGVIGFLFVVLWVPARVGWFSAVLVLAPLFVARWAFVQYGDELRSQERTLRALVSAVETKDPSSVGHGDRTAQLAEWLGEVMGLGYRDIQDVRTAAMLHDIGKVSVPTKYLHPRRPLGEDELVVIAGHALSGVELVKGIDFLTGSIDGIAHHHERYDGQGYPSSIEGESIPLVARIVAVADTFDGLTTARPYRPPLTNDEALAVVRDRAGTQFDPHVVDALVRALDRHEWVPSEAPPRVPSLTTTLDHDEPEVSDLFASRPDLRMRVRSGTSSVSLPMSEIR